MVGDSVARYHCWLVMTVKVLDQYMYCIILITLIGRSVHI